MDKSAMKTGEGGSPNGGFAPLVDIAQALESFRDSGHDFATSAGEVIDNAIEARATTVRIRLISGSGGVEAVAFADDGYGIPRDILRQMLSLGFSTRFGMRNGIGRFGVGAKIAALSQGQRVDVYSKARGSNDLLHTYLDLEEVKARTQTGLGCSVLHVLPNRIADLISPHSSLASFTGTIVVWSKLDRLKDGGAYKSASKEAVDELIKFVSRAYRKFLNNGFKIIINDSAVELHDPLFLLPNPRLINEFGDGVTGDVISLDDLDVFNGEERSLVRLTVTTAPQRFRTTGGEGGRLPRSTRISSSTQGNVSLVRSGREIQYSVLRGLFPGSVVDIDRFIGVEIAFDPTIDELMQVRNVKRGAEPNAKLFEILKKRLEQPIKEARQQIRKLHRETAAREANATHDHQKIIVAANRVNKEMPRVSAGGTVDEATVADKLRHVLIDIDDSPGVASIETFRETLKSHPVQLMSGAWPGRQLFDITHVNESLIVKLNHRHRLMAEIYDRVASAAKSERRITEDQSRNLLSMAKLGFDALLLSYGRAESVAPDADEKYANLRDYWGIFCETYLQEAFKTSDKL